MSLMLRARAGGAAPRFAVFVSCSVSLGFWLALSAEPASACSVCIAGDQIYSSQGATAQSQGNLSAYFEMRGWRKTSGVLPGENGAPEEGAEPEPPGKERNVGQRADLYLSATPIDRITLTVDLPWVWNEITESEGGTKHTSALSGFGDLSAQVSGVLWRNRDVLPSTWVEARGFVKFPTGESSQSVDGVKDPHLQVGTGSTDYGLGAAVVHKLEWAILYTSGSYRINTKGSLHYEYGDVALANAAIAVPLGHALGVSALAALTPGLELNYRWADYDEFHGERYRDSGGSILYVTPSLRIAVPWPAEWGRLSVRGAVQIPTTSAWLHGFQKEDPIWSAGVQYAY
jgi:hypothetical protein